MVSTGLSWFRGEPYAQACATKCSHKHARYMRRERLLIKDIAAAAERIAEFTPVCNLNRSS